MRSLLRLKNPALTVVTLAGAIFVLRQIDNIDNAFNSASDGSAAALNSDVLPDASDSDGDDVLGVEGVDQEDPRLWKTIRKHYSIAPSRQKYRLLNATIDPSMGQGKLVQQLMAKMPNGFFIECGAYDGETRSNTLALERDLGWTGLLIEGNPESLSDLLGKNRKAWVVPACLSTTTKTQKVTFGAWANQGRIVAFGEKKLDDYAYVSAFCLPLYAILKAFNRTDVDYFSLDVEGNELDVLRTIPFKKVNITSLSVEFGHIGESHTKGDSGAMVAFMASQGYTARAQVIDNVRNTARDYIFVKSGFREHIELEDIVYNVE